MTVIVVALVLAGPSFIACSQGGAGLGACLRQRVVDAGLLPPENVATVAAAPQIEPGSPQPAPSAAVPAPAPRPEDAAAAPPELTLLRAQPDGSLVIAGTGRPGARIEVYANGELLGTTTAEPSGDWAIVPEGPIAAGGVEISIGELGGGRPADRSFVVVIDPDRASEPLVVATRPGEASAVLQGLSGPAAVPAEIAAPPEPEPPAPGPAPVAQPAAEVAALEPEPAPPAPQVEPEPQVAEPEVPSGSALEAPAAAAAPVPAIPAPAPSPAEPALAPGPVPEPEAPDLSVATVEPERIEPGAAPAPMQIIPPSIDAVEIDGAANFFAGGGTDGATIRLYVADKFVADAPVEQGRWLVETTNVLTQPSQRVRVDMLKPGTAEVVARAEVDFVIDLPPSVEALLPPSEAARPAPQPKLPPVAAEPAPEAAPPPKEVTEPAIFAEPSDRALTPAADSAATPPPGRDLAATSDAVPAATEFERELGVAAEAEPVLPLERDLGAAEKPATELGPTADLAQLPKEAAPTGDKAIETADVSEADVNASKLLAPPAKPIVPAPQPGPAAAPQPGLAKPVSPVPGALAAPPQPRVVVEAEPAAKPQPAADAAAAPAGPAKPSVDAKPAAPATTASAPAVPLVPEGPEPAAAPSPTIAAIPPGEAPVPTLRAVPVGGPESLRFASGKAIIRRGDNLWSISRRVYGTGLKYTTIYRANKDQIRSPHRIYPGQVFDLPLVFED